MARYTTAFRYTNKTRCREASQFEELFEQKFNSESGTNRELRPRTRNQLRNTLIGVRQQLLHGSITDERKLFTRTDQIAYSHQTNNQSEARHVQKLQTSDIERNNRSSLLPAQSSVRISNINSYHLEIPLQK